MLYVTTTKVDPFGPDLLSSRILAEYINIRIILIYLQGPSKIIFWSGIILIK
jgi:hypothetical protein